MDVAALLLDSWDRQCLIVKSVADLVDDKNRLEKPSDDGWPLFEQLAHVHNTRRFWLKELDGDRAKALDQLFQTDGWADPVDDLPRIKAALADSATAIRETVAAAIAEGRTKCGGYDNPILFLQHMVWHEGWHVGLIMLALRQAGQEPSEEWQEANIWGHWRTEEW